MKNETKKDQSTEEESKKDEIMKNQRNLIMKNQTIEYWSMKVHSMLD